TATRTGCSRRRVALAGQATLLNGGRTNRHAALVTAVPLVLDDPVDRRVQREVPPHADEAAGMDLGAELTDEDVAGHDRLAAVDLHAAALTLGVATVAGATLTFFVSHLRCSWRSLASIGCPYRARAVGAGTSGATASPRRS